MTRDLLPETRTAKSNWFAVTFRRWLPDTKIGRAAAMGTSDFPIGPGYGHTNRSSADTAANKIGSLSHH